MKKLVTIFALFTMVMLTSFVEPTTVKDKNSKFNTKMEIGGKGKEIVIVIGGKSKDIV